MHIELPEPSRDPRGYIQNLLELSESDRPIRGVGVIFSRARTTRSNHWHRLDGHYLYVHSGLMHYWERALTEKQYARDPVIVKPGQMVYTGSELLHRTHFPEESIVLSFSHLPRDHASHEADVVRDGTK